MDGRLSIDALTATMEDISVDASKLPVYLGLGTTALAGLLLLRRYFCGGLNRSTASLVGKTAIVTGANTGLGYQSAKDFAKRGARVIMACRNARLGEAAASKIRSETRNDQVAFRELDLASLESVRRFASTITNSQHQIHILLNNAGVMACPKNTTVDGFEYQLGVNHLGHFLLTNLLLDRVIESAPSRIVNVTSRAGVREKAKIDFDDIHLDRAYNSWAAYGQSKLANILFTLELARRVKGTGVTVNCCHPGVVMTELARHMNFPLWKKILFAPFVFILKTPWWGAQTQLYLSMSDDVAQVSGQYFADCAPVTNIPAQCTDIELAQKLWRISEEMVRL